VRYHWLIPLAAALANLIVFVPVLRQGVRHRMQRAFAGMTLVLATWNLDIFSLYYFSDVAAAEWWSRMFRVGICFAPAAVLHFALVLSGTEGPAWGKLLGGSYIIAAAFAVANLQGVLVERLVPHDWGWYIEPTPLYSAFTVCLLTSFVISGERIWHAYRHSSSPRQRVQARFWLLAFLIAMPFSLTNFLPMYGIRIYPLGSVGNVFYVWTIAYAIVRHRLMDVDYVVRKVVSFALAALVVFLPGGAALAVLARELGSEEPLLLSFAGVALGLVAVVLIPALQEALETRVQRAFFAERFDYRRRLRQVASDLAHILDETALVKRLGDALFEILDVEGCHVFVRDERTRKLTRGYPTSAASEVLADDVAQALEQLAAPTLASEVETSVGPVAALFRAARWEVAFPLRINDRVTGLVALERNKDFRIFSGEDLQVLTEVGAGASVALENASLSRQLRRSEIVLERANRLSSLGMLAAGIAHEIRNPLVAVKTFLDLLPDRLGDREFLSHFRDLSLGELRRVTDLIADLLALGKSKTAERRAVDVAVALEPVVRLMESTAKKRSVEVEASFEPRLPPVWADPDQLKQIILNLLLNAIDTSPAGGRVALDVRRMMSDIVVLEVRDQGAGIPPEQLETIFHPFYTTKETGTGLGLTLVHQMVVEHGGEITVDSAPGRGSVFRVTLPTPQVDLARTGT
jgi:signal transduction histidine kinase